MFLIRICKDFNYLYRRASDLLLDTPRYPLFGEKSIQFTFPTLSDVLGKFENIVLDGTCN